VTVTRKIQIQIRQLDAAGVPGREIARRLAVPRDSVAKYANLEDCPPASLPFQGALPPSTPVLQSVPVLEKGSMDNAVGFLRRNLMIPIPHATSLRALTKVGGISLTMDIATAEKPVAWRNRSGRWV
jgi:hypothetical protein